jgi:hypothetical protein
MSVPAAHSPSSAAAGTGSSKSASSGGSRLRAVRSMGANGSPIIT